MEAAHPINAMGADLAHEPLPAAEIIAGSPSAALVELGAFSGVQFGIWEMTEGAATDVEDDEVFIVLTGRARIEFVEPEKPAIEVGPGDIVRLEAGMHTRWTVTETLRKIWIA